MKRIILTLSIMFLLISLTGCGNTVSDEETPNPILEKIYMHNTLQERTFDFNFIMFYDDNTFQGIEADSFSKDYITGELKPIYVHYYGTYEIAKNSLTMNMSDSSYTGVIKEGGDSIIFGTDEYVNWTENLDKNDSLWLEFQQ